MEIWRSYHPKSRKEPEEVVLKKDTICALTWFQSKFEDRLQKQLFKCSTSRPHHCFECLARLHQVGIEQVLSEMSANPSSWEHKSTTNPPSPSVVIHLPFGSHPGWKSNPHILRYYLLIIYNLQTKKCLVIFRRIQCHCLI